MAKSRRSKTRISAPGTKHALNAEQALTVAQAKRLTSKAPNKADAWLQLGIAYVGVNRHSEAIEPLQRAVSLSGEAAHIHAWLAAAYLGASEFLLAKESAKHALNLDEHSVRALIILAMIDFDNGLSAGALKWIEKAENVEPENSDVLHAKSRALFGLHRYEEAEAVLEALTRHHPENLRYWNELGVVQRELGKLASSANSFSQAIKYGDNSTPFSNLITGFHYDPSKQQSDIAAVCREWQSRYGVKKPPARPVPENRSPDRKLRIGLLSDGFRQHPVGNMIIAALENTHPEEMEFYFYSTSASNDAITKRFQALASQWQMVKYQDDAAFNQQVRDDKIDILFDLAGHNAGTRSKAISMQPAPLIVKWVGGLINTTGVEAIDYLISDHIETPEGEDQHYTEKLIRLPDDYIVYSQPTYTPNIGPLPALSNDFITLGCFNNPTKLNAQLLTEWAILMNQLPNSRLFLKGKPYTSESFCERIYALMESLGVERERVLLEGPAAHRELLNSYNRVDIALDPWPYSGGLSTCEALLMGVPVVTLPGPTFAGRHSASHLINADMAELVVNNWDEYRERVIELASDTDSLSTIRNSLRQVLLQSPMCDGRRFAKHLMLAMRAIWQRYCEDKVPAALAFNKNSELWFEDDQKLLDIQVKEKPPEPEKGFKWKFDGQIVVLDNASKTLRNRALSLMVKTNAFAIVAFDPQSLIENREVFTANKNIQLFQHALLGDGKSTTLYACLEPTLSSTLPPLPNEQLPPSKRLGARVLTKLPISTIALDSIQGLASLDWLVLDGLSDAATILENGAEALKDTLLVEVQVAFQATHKRQPNLAELQYWASRNGFRFYRLNASRYISHLPESVPTKKRQATELESADAIFLPSHERMANLSDNQRTKLAFLLHTIYGIKDMTYELLAQVSQEKAEEYLVGEELAAPVTQVHSSSGILPQSELVKREPEKAIGVGLSSDHQSISYTLDDVLKRLRKAQDSYFLHICFNNMHTQSLIEGCSSVNGTALDKNLFLIDKAKSIEGYTLNPSGAEVVLFDASKEFSKIVDVCKQQNVSGVYVHGLFFDWQKRLVAKIGEYKRMAWVIWGGDVYRYKKANKEMLNLVENIACVATVTSDDYTVYKRLFGQKKHFDFAYRFPFDELDKSLPVTKEKLIIIGNSGDIGNNHVEIFDALSAKKDINDYKIIVPCSYNAPVGYASEMHRYSLSKGLSKNRVEILTEFLSKDDYFDLIARAELLVTAHDRSQAGATINAAIYFGTKVVLKKHIFYHETHMQNPMWNRLSDMSIQCIEFLDFIKSNTVKQLPSKNDSMVEKDRNNLRKARGDEALGDNLARINSFLKV